MLALLGDARKTPLHRSVVIVGRSSMQNWLLAQLIDERLGCDCQVRPVYQFNGVSAPQDAIVLLDVEGMSTNHVGAHARAVLANGPHRSIALMNAEESSVEELAYAPGVRGVFFRDTSQDNLLKGLRVMLAGDYWLPRSVLTAHFERTRFEVVAAGRAVALTRKEAETLNLLVGGHSNNAIARRLSVSPHTVKTHLYHLFRKIGAANRVQAVKWAMQDVSHSDRGPG